MTCLKCGRHVRTVEDEARIAAGGPRCRCFQHCPCRGDCRDGCECETIAAAKKSPKELLVETFVSRNTTIHHDVEARVEDIERPERGKQWEPRHHAVTKADADAVRAMISKDVETRVVRVTRVETREVVG